MASFWIGVIPTNVRYGSKFVATFSLAQSLWNIRYWPRVCENLKLETSSGNYPLYFLVSELNMVCVHPNKQIYSSLVKYCPKNDGGRIVFTHPRPEADGRYRRTSLMLMPTGSVHVAVLEFLFTGIADFGDLHIERQLLASQRMITINIHIETAYF